jgi:membrane associated rhomboid family serine protease
MGNAIPVSDNTLTRSEFYGTKTIIVLSALVYLAQLFNASLVQDFSVIAEKVVKDGQIYRLFTAALLHGDILHIAGNMWFLWVFGKSVEDKIGWKMYAAFYCAAAVISSALYIATTTNKTMPCIGASGAISGIIGAYLIFFPRTKLKFQFLYSMHTPVFAPAWTYILGWILLNFFFGVLQTGSGTRGVAYWGHIGGFVAGIISAHMYQSLRQK